MRTNLNKTNLTLRKTLSLPTLRAVLMVLLVAFGVGNAWAHSTHNGKVTFYNATGNGTVYLSTASGSNSGETAKSSPESKNGYSQITWSCSGSSDKDAKTLYPRGTVAAGYYYLGWSTSSSATSGYSTGSLSANASSDTDRKIYGYFETIKVTAAPADVNINATDPSATYPDAAGVVVGFTTSSSNANSDFTTGGSGDSRWTISAWPTHASATSTTFNYKFVGNGSYGTNNRTLTKTVTLKGLNDATVKTCTLTAKYPNPRVIECNEGSTDLTIYPTFSAADATQAAVEKTAVFDVVYADNANNFSAAFSGATGSGTWTVTGISVDQNNQKATVTYTFNGSKSAGTHTAVLTLTANNCQGWDDTSAAGGASANVTLTAENTQEATNDASVTTTANVTTEYATFAQALAAANATSGATLTLLRNVDLGTITATNNITKAMTIDLNGKELRAAVNATSVGILTITKAVAVTIKDSKTGGKIINEIARNSEIRTIFVNAAGASLTLESGTLAVNNLGQYASKAATVNDVAVAQYSGCTARVIHQVAGSTVNINGGKLDAKGTRSVYGIVQGSSAATNKAGTTVLNVTGGEIAVEAPYNALGIYAYGKVNMSAGVINTHITTNLIDAAYAADNGNNTNNGYGYGILMKVSVSATASSCYYGTLNMTGGTINVISDRKKAADLRNYGIYLEAAATGVGAGKTATDGTLSQKASAKASIENANITVHSNTYYSYGIIVYGSYNSYDNEYFTVPIKNCNIDVQAYLYTYAICANAAVNSTYGGCYWGDVELTGNTVTAESVTTHTAHAVLVLATTAHIFKDANTTTAPIYYGEYATAAKAVINSGTYTAKTKTTTAYAVCSSTRAKTIYDPETKVETNRKPSGKAEAYPIVIIHGGTFRGEATTTTSRAVSSGGYTTIDGGTFEAFSTSTTAYGLYAVSGKLTASGATISANATQYAYGAYADCGDLPAGNTAQTGFAYAAEMELNNCDITATTRTSTEARGVVVNAKNKMHNWAQFKADSTSNKWATTTYNAYKSVFPCTIAGRDSVGIAIAAKATINGCDIKVTAGTTTAYGVYSTATSVPASADSVASPVVNIKNTKFTVKTDGTTTAYGMYAGGPTTIDGCDFTVQPKTTTAYGVYAYDKKTTITNTKFDVKGTNTVYGLYANAAIGSTTGWDYHGEFELGEGNDMTVAATGGDASHVLTLIAAKKNVATGRFMGDYANAATAHITGGSYKATATGKTCYVLNLSANQVQNAVSAAPTCTIEGGKFWAKATGGTDGICTTNGVNGNILFKGGVYNVNTTLSKHIPEGYEEVPLASDRPEYTEGYRYVIEPEGNHGIYVCQIGNTKYKSLEEALQVVTSGQTILMIANYVMVEPGDYVLPAGATLLVPRSGQTTAQGTTIASGLRSNTRVAPSANLTLTFGNGVNLAAFGTIETGGLENDGGGGAQTGCTHGSYGRIILRSGAHIDLESGAKLQCWGYITGDGTITAKSGSQVYEYFEIAVCKGGTILSGMIDNSRYVFPLDDYFYQNIESEITYKPGCQAFASSGMYIQGNRPANSVKIVGNTTSHLFCMSTDGSRPNMWVKKKYDPTTDRCTWTLNDGAQLSSINITISGYGMNSSDYVLPIASSMDIVMNYGTLSISSGQNVMLNPGSRMIIKKDATLKIPSGVKFYVWDVAQWNLGEPSAKYAWSSLYQPDRATNPRSGILTDKTNLPSGEIFVQGTLEVSGDIQTTGGGAYIHSTNEDAGQVVFKTSATATGTVYQYTSGKHYTASSTTSAKLQNGDGTYEATAGSANGDKWIYRDGKWVKVSTDGCFVVETISGTPHYYAHPKDWVEVTANSPDDHAYHVTADPTRFVIQGKDCNWIEVVPAEGYYKCINENSIYYNSYFEWSESNGYWVEKFLTIKFNNQGTVTTYSNIPYKSRPFYQGTTPTKTSSDANYYYVWTGWDTSSSNTGAAEYGKLEGDLPEATGDVTYYAHFDQKYYQYNITFKNDDGTVLDSRNWNKGTTPSYAGTPTKNPTAAETYEFNGTWSPAITTVTGSATYTAQYTATPREYTITFLNYDMSKLGTAEVVYNNTPSNATYLAAVAPLTEDPYKPDNSAYSFEFAGWRLQGASSNGFAQVKGDQTYIAQYNQTTKKYKISFVDDDGETVLHWTQLEYGQTPSYTWDNPANKQDVEWNYTFAGWDPSEFAVVESAQTYTAVYNKTKREYTITWKDGDGNTLKTDQVAYGETPEYSGATPTKNPTDANSFVFNNTWSPAIVAVVGEATYTAQFDATERKYKVTWDANGGACATEYTDFSYNDAIGTLPVASKEGHTFNGWFTSATGGTQITTATKVTADVTYHAQFTVNPYTITFDSNGGSAVASITQNYGTAVTAPANPTREGYTFNGWSPAVPSTMPVNGLTCVAQWTVNPYTISFNSNGGSSVASITQNYGTAVTAPADPSREGYTFAGWSPAVPSTMPVNGLTCVAQWTINKYKVTFDSNGGSAVSTIEQDYNTAVTAPANPTREGYTFNGWSPAVPSTMPVDGLTCVAQWTVNPYTITFDSNGGSAVASITQNYGTAVTAPADPTREGYTFAGWNPAVPSTMPVDGLTCVAQWTVNPYTITFDSNGGSSVASITQNYGTAVTAPANPTREGYTFNGWSPAVPSTMPVNGLTCVAQWTVNPYTISFNSNGGSSVASITQNYGTAVTAPADPSREGYTFAGWSPAVPSTMPVNGLTCVAQWTPKQYTITFNSNGGSDVSSITQDYGTSVSAPANPTREGYTFAGWDPAVPGTMPLSGLTCNAQWTPNENTEYKVRHYKQNLDDDYYTFDKEVTETGTTDEYTMSSPLPDEGFVAIPWEENTIAADGSTVVEIYYNRKTYTVTWWDAQETLADHVIAEQTYKYGATPSYTYNKPSDGAYYYVVTGWTPGIEEVTEDITYTAVYKAIPLNLVVADQQTINSPMSLNSTTVRVSGHLSIAPTATLTTTDLILEASSDASGEITGAVEATNVYFDYAVESDGRHWNVFGVPFEIGDLDAVKLQYKNAEESSWHPMILGTHYDITYYDEATRAAQGPVHDCWKYVEDKPAGQRTLQPGIAYSIAFLHHIDTLRFTKASASSIEYTADVNMANTNIGDATNGGWNGIANPKTYHALLTTGVTMIQIHDGGEMGKDGYDAYRIADYKFVVGKAGYVQVHDATVLNVTQAGDQNPIPAHIAARRTTADEASELYTVEFNAEGTQTDRVYVRTEEGKLDEYTVGSDVMKMSVSSVRPQLWVDRYNMKLCMNTVAPINGQAAYPLGLYAPAAGEYTIALQPTEDNANTIYLTCDGVVIWNLTYSPYLVQLEKGTNARYGLQIVHTEAPAVTTGIVDAQAGTQPTAQKVLLNDKVYILRGTNVYTVEGQMVK